MSNTSEMKGKPITRGELRPCDHCKQGLMHQGLPIAMRVTVEMLGLNERNTREHHAMDVMFPGMPAVAAIMAGVDAPIWGVADRDEYVLCWNCAM